MHLGTANNWCRTLAPSLVKAEVPSVTSRGIFCKSWTTCEKEGAIVVEAFEVGRRPLASHQGSSTGEMLAGHSSLPGLLLQSKWMMEG